MSDSALISARSFAIGIARLPVADADVHRRPWRRLRPTWLRHSARRRRSPRAGRRSPPQLANSPNEAWAGYWPPPPQHCSASWSTFPHAATDHLIQALARPACLALNASGALSRAHRKALTDIVATCLTATPPTTAVGFLPGLRRYNVYAALPTITARTIVVSGGADILTPTAHALDLVAGIDYATHLHLPGGGHMLLQEAPHLVGAALERAMCGPAAHTRRASPPRPTRPRVLEAI